MPDAAAPRRTRRGILAIVVAGIAGLVSDSCCAKRMGSIVPTPGVAASSLAAGEDAVTLQYLRCGGWLIRRGDAAIMTGPFFSNPSFLRTGVATIATDPEAVEANLKNVAGVGDVSAILVGHAHYDHLMDTPYVATHHATRAVVYGSETTGHVLAAVPELAGRVEVINDRAAQGDAPGKFTSVAGGRIRFMPIVSEHAPHFMGIKLYGGKLDHDLEELPRRAGKWKEGQTFAYVIDFMSEDGARVDFRIHYQDSASSPPFGHPPRFGGADDAPYDVAILCGASHTQVDDYPEAIVKRLSPRKALVGHWEDFFIPTTAELKFVRANDVPAFLRRLDACLATGTERVLAKPGAIYSVPVKGATP